MAPATKGGMHFLERSEVGLFSSGEARLSGFHRQRRHKKWRPKGRRTSPAGTVSQPIGRPFYGQAKGQLWLTWRSYARPPQYFIPPEGGALNPPVRRSRSQAEPWQPRAERPGGWLNPHARKGVSTYGNTGKHRPEPGLDPDSAKWRLNLQAPQGLVQLTSTLAH